MTAGDWARGSKTRLVEEPPKKAVSKSLQELHRGITRRWRWFLAQRSGYAHPMNVAGQTSVFHVEEIMDVERARTVNREKHVLEWLFKSVDGTATLWDIGGYHGHYAVHAANIGATVVCFEPNAENRKRIRKNMQLNDIEGVDLKDYALSDSDAVKQFGGPETSELAVGNGSWRVETKRGDTITPKPDAVKVDVEGHEVAVLDGLADTLPNIERIAIEVHSKSDVPVVRERLEKAGLWTLELQSERTETFIGGSNVR